MALSFCGKQICLNKKFLPPKRCQHGYIVLLPEIGEDVSDKKSIIAQKNGLPEFNNVTIENCRAAIAKQTLDFEAGVKEIEDKISKRPCEDIFSEVFQPLEELGSSLDATWGLSKTLYLGNSTLMPTSSYMSIHERAKRARVSKFNNRAIYNAVQSKLQDGKIRSSEEKRILQKFAIEGKLNGLELDSKGKVLLAEYLSKLAKERTSFKQKIEVATKQFSHIIRDKTVVREFPEGLLKALSPHPNDYLNAPWKITLNPHIYMPVMEYCPDREIRWNIWQALVSRGSIQRDRELITSIHLEEIRASRQDIAKLLGYSSYAEMSMETKMAGSVSKVQTTLATLLESAKPAQEEELKSLHKFATSRGFSFEKLELWDIPYWRRKQQKSEFNYNDNTLKEYFPLSNVLKGLFNLCEKLFNITIKQRNPYVRTEEKIRNQAALIFNFEPPIENQQSLLKFKEVQSLFNKFGYAMQHLLTQTNYSEVAGLSNIEWDAVEISGHIFGHWLYNKTVIDSISCHYQSGDKLPEDQFQALLNVREHMAGSNLCRELYLSSLDLELHSSKDFWLDIVKRLWPNYRDFTLHKIDAHPCSFTQIFTEEWGAAYYSHIWAQMIAADVYSAFHEVQGDEQQTTDVGKRFRDTFLALGGSEHPNQVFREFRGRDPSPKALLRSLGLRKSSNKK
ncbi:hypothetical protein NQ317_012298 [Molorchus minor]|uniref:Peptidase M3A/M3B catalytic domain-containing protein n=1 Tax=Molorchus minor TaxID=1323400 RepID=A0ABQ9J1U3_9CUCU|nr:hypothetical protein NQ317_012298 [Molorchus minor]